MGKRKWKGKLTKHLLTIGDSDAGRVYVQEGSTSYCKEREGLRR